MSSLSRTTSAAFSSISSASRSAVRSLAPFFIPLVIGLLFIPLVLFLSLLAGWLVWRNLAVGWEVPLYFQYGDGRSPYAQVALPTLSARQRYDVAVLLNVPAIESNLALGNFMASLTLSTFSNETIVAVRRPAIVIPPTSSFFFSGPKQVNLDIPLLQAFATGTSKIVAMVEVGRRDAWKSLGNGYGRELSVTLASLRGTPIPHGVRGLAMRFPLLSALISATIFLVVLSVFLGTCLLPVTTSRRKPTIIEEPTGLETTVKQVKEDEAVPIFPPSYDSSENEKPVHRRRRSRLSRSLSNSTKTKPEPSVVDMPAVSGSTKRLRRRSSRRSEGTSDIDSW